MSLVRVLLAEAQYKSKHQIAEESGTSFGIGDPTLVLVDERLLGMTIIERPHKGEHIFVRDPDGDKDFAVKEVIMDNVSYGGMNVNMIVVVQNMRRSARRSWEGADGVTVKKE